jgi:predicted nucleotidyltransferase
VNPVDPNIALLESIAAALGPLRDRFVFVGGCATGMLVTDVAAAPVRATRDVDAIVEVLTLAEYHALERELEKRGFSHDRSPEAPICRWVVGTSLLDVMPTDERVLGFANRWFTQAIHTAVSVKLPSGKMVKRVTPPLFLATKLEAFRGRGSGDFLASHDLEDIITVVDGRHELLEDVRASAAPLRTYVAREIGALLQSPEFNQALPGHLAGDETSQERVPLIKERLRQLSLVARPNSDHLRG